MCVIFKVLQGCTKFISIVILPLLVIIIMTIIIKLQKSENLISAKKTEFPPLSQKRKGQRITEFNLGSILVPLNAQQFHHDSGVNPKYI